MVVCSLEETLLRSGSAVFVTLSSAGAQQVAYCMCQIRTDVTEHANDLVGSSVTVMSPSESLAPPPADNWWQSCDVEWALDTHVAVGRNVEMSGRETTPLKAAHQMAGQQKQR